MSESKLDQLVKGAPPPGKVAPLIPSSGVVTSPPPTLTSLISSLSDPLASLPSSPAQIYLNLLILEASLRAQYLELRARRRQYTFFLTLLGLWNLYFGYALYLAPREDGSGVGGSIYWVIEVTEKVAFMGGIVTGILVWGTGQWERGIRWPRRWVGISNRGLRGFNCKIVVIKGPWWKEWVSAIWHLVSDGLSLSSSASLYRFVDAELESEREKGPRTGLPDIYEDDGPAVGREEDLSPGGDTIKLLLLPKPFSPAFRENWDLYRSEYWERENDRRRLLLQKLKTQDKQRAKQQPRPTLLSRLRLQTSSKSSAKDVEKSHHHAHLHVQSSRPSSLSAQAADNKRLRASTSTRSNSHSRTSSRSSSPTPDLDDGLSGGGPSNRIRRGSNASGSTSSASSSLRRKKASTSTSASTSPADKGTGTGTGTGTAGSMDLNIDGNAVATKPSARLQKLTPAAAGVGGGRSVGITGLKTRPHSFVRGNSFSSSASTDGSVSGSGSGAGSRPVTPASVGSGGGMIDVGKGGKGEEG